MQSWDVKEIQAPEGTRLAAVLETVDGARAITVRLGAGEELGASRFANGLLIVVEGTARIEAGGDVVDAGPGTLLALEPGERHSVASDGGAPIAMSLSSRLGLATTLPRPDGARPPSTGSSMPVMSRRCSPPDSEDPCNGLVSIRTCLLRRPGPTHAGSAMSAA